MLCCFVLVHGDCCGCPSTEDTCRGCKWLEHAWHLPISTNHRTRCHLKVHYPKCMNLAAIFPVCFMKKTTRFSSSFLQLNMTSEVCVIYGKGYKHKHPFLYVWGSVTNQQFVLGCFPITANYEMPPKDKRVEICLRLKQVSHGWVFLRGKGCQQCFPRSLPSSVTPCKYQMKGFTFPVAHSG